MKPVTYITSLGQVEVSQQQSEMLLAVLEKLGGETPETNVQHLRANRTDLSL